MNWKNPDYDAIWKSRSDEIDKIRKDENYYKSIAIHYKHNPVDFINDWGVTFDPRRDPSLMPFILFPRQEEYILWLKKQMDDGQSCVVEKSRDMGATWLNMAFAIWLWLFWPGKKIGFGSRKEALVDKLGDPDSIFEKGRMFLRYLPREFLPFGFDIDEHAPFLKIINPDNGSVITGEAGDNIGRGGRNTIYFKDESAFYERPDKIDASLAGNTDVRVDVSTPNGTGNPFYQKRVGGIYPVFTFHWRSDPRKDEAWYKKQKRELDPVILAQEVDIDYSASTEMICIPAEWVQACVNFNIEESGMKIGALDVADEGGDENCFGWRHGIVVKGIEWWKEGNTTETTRKAYGKCVLNNIKMLRYDSIGVGAGVKGEMWAINQETQKMKVVPHGIHSGGKPPAGNFEPGKPWQEMFLNMKSAMWWDMRRRMQRVYNQRYNNMKYPIEQLISIPNEPGLIVELSQPKYKFARSGKIQIEKKEDMKKRGLKSPNRADMLMLLFAKLTSVDYNLLNTL